MVTHVAAQSHHAQMALSMRSTMVTVKAIKIEQHYADYTHIRVRYQVVQPECG